MQKVILYIEDVDLNGVTQLDDSPSAVILYIEDVDLNAMSFMEEGGCKSHPLH